ncbi:hypothetical protein N7450_011671 [Penicillium hetheringtonii]|uniref:Uncharacterized protein n=1 Tax=Penicillium hetheringtonii TaxID=911720 RepID=A0AAD6DAH7_9EURO|nr:hypothetical protein N7450_011671 [Penicillium hetheringtonii]
MLSSKSNCAKDIRSPSYLYHQIHVEASVFSRRISVLADPGRAVLRRVLITGGYFTAQPGPPRVTNRRRPSASSTTISFINDHQLHQRPSASSTTTSFINDQQRPATTHPNQRLPSTHHDHESRSLSSIITKPTHSSSLQPRQNSHKDIDYSGWQRHSPTTNHAGTYRVSKLNGPIHYAMSYEASAQCTGSGND